MTRTFPTTVQMRGTPRGGGHHDHQKKAEVSMKDPTALVKDLILLHANS